MERILDARGLSCPLPLIKARAALDSLAAGETLVVLATDPEAPVDLGAPCSAHSGGGGHIGWSIRWCHD